MRHLLLVAMVTVGVAACQQIDKDKLEKMIRDDLVSHKLIVKSVDCPSGQAIKKDDVFSCKVKTDHQELDAKVTQTDDKGSVTYAVTGSAVNEKELGDSLEAKIGNGIDVQCGDQSGVYVKGDVIHCETKHPDGAIAITFQDNDGNVEWKLTPK